MKAAQKIDYNQSSKIAEVLAFQYSVLFYCIVLYSILFYSVLFYSNINYVKITLSQPSP